ncbi:MAG: phosphoenolpyruvate--protein phosphotransferase [Planctomycetota bacterium]|nr:phosphoenolpyruvate--protein phosphotransferase [Planctomycetota bacterium]
MNIPHALAIVIQRSHSLSAILDSAVDIIAEQLGTDVCSIYLLDPTTRRLQLMATHGLDKAAIGKVSLELGQGLTGIVVSEMRAVAVDDASSHPGYLYFPETREERFRSYLGVPMVLRNRPVGAIVVQTAEERVHSEEDIQTLYTIAAQLVGVVENARLIDALDRGEEGSGAYLRDVRAWHPGDRSEDEQTDLCVHGSAASAGIAMAQAVFRGFYDVDPEELDQSFRGEEAEKSRVREALRATGEDILKIQESAAKEADEEHALIFSSHLLLLNDPVLLEHIDASIDQGAAAPRAVYRALNEFGDRLRKVPDAYVQERIHDILDLRNRLLGHLLYGEAHTPSVSDRIVITRETPPSLVVELKAKRARALVTEIGGATSHGALLARSMGIPAVTGVRDISRLVKSGDALIVDGGRGRVVIRPTAAVVEEYEERARRLEERRSENLKYSALPGKTADGKQVTVLANIGVAADLVEAERNGAQGIGLYRTEFPFIIREHFPTREEQVRIYRKAYDVFPEGPVHFRLLDLGGDKFVPAGRIHADRNPFSGYRAIRVLLDHTDVLCCQVQAFAIAAGSRPLSLLIPMVSSVDELRRVKGIAGEALEALGRSAPPRFGVMIELPAAVEIARDLAGEADFFSVGTNDLIQYALAIDRENSRVASDHDPYHPAILRMIRRTVEAGHLRGIPVGVCGEMASDTRLALVLVAMGLDSLSVTPRGIPELKQTLATHEVAPIVARLDAILELSTAADVEKELRKLLPE